MYKKLFLFSLCFLAIGCSSSVTRGIHGSDSSVVIPEAELEFTIVGDDVTYEQPEKPGVRVALRASYSAMKGDFNQSLATGEYVDYDTNAPYTGNSRYDGPVTLNHKGDLGLGYLGGILYWHASKEIALSYQIGLGNIDMKLDTSGGGLSSSFGDNETSIYSGFGLHYHYNSFIDIEGLYRSVMAKSFPFFFFTMDDYYSVVNDAVIRVVLKQNAQLKYFAGYRMVNYAYTCLDCKDDPSSIYTDFSGLSLGIGVTF